MLNIPWRASARTIALAASVALIFGFTASPAHAAADSAPTADFSLLAAWADTSSTTETDYALVSDAAGLHRFDGQAWTTVDLPTAVACIDPGCTNVSAGRVSSAGVVSLISGKTVALYSLKDNAAVVSGGVQSSLTLPADAEQISANATVVAYKSAAVWYSWSFGSAAPTALADDKLTQDLVIAGADLCDDNDTSFPVAGLVEAGPYVEDGLLSVGYWFGWGWVTDGEFVAGDVLQTARATGRYVVASVSHVGENGVVEGASVNVRTLETEDRWVSSKVPGNGALLSVTPNGVLTEANGTYSWLPIIQPTEDDPDLGLGTTTTVALGGYSKLEFVANLGSGTPIAKFTDAQGVVGLARLTYNGTTASLTEITHLKVVGSEVSITGNPVVGQALSAVSGDWAPAGATLAYQWSANGVALAGATSATYVVGEADLGKAITVQVTGTKTGYETAATTSEATVAVTAAVPEIVAGTVSITGTAAVGQKLSASLADWPTDATFTYQWLRGTTVVGSNASYTVTAGDAGNQLSVRVTGTVSGAADLVATSAAVSVPAATGKQFAAAPRPVILGSARLNHTLLVYPGWWRPAPVKLSVQWYRDGVAIRGATKAYYRLGRADRGARITVAVTGTKSGYVTTTKVSSATGTVR
jgi:hypothetical protein